ncbi:MAG: S26 family signal peptidase, partial [Spirochaetales bacterium]|nr:S26 family signal peptidase [Spirochaetales bacterium]
KSIEKNKIFVIGDNLENSIDSRKFGFITFNEILGKVLND